ncbi:hypothetical protein [Polynucleobacter sp. MWH-UH23A]|uniref:hypothetical protein n=1 Tax=Polynucleobacter sp. MWH-UH23A TaxID=1855613 RepID=UPI0033652323
MNTINQNKNFYLSDSNDPELLSWSFGKDIYDVKPKNFQGSWDDFISFISSNKAHKKGVNYISSPFGNDGGRRKDNAMGRNWIPFDIDCKMSDEQARALVGVFRSFQCLGYQTASSKPDMRRMRFIAKLTRPVTELEAGAIGHLFESMWGLGEFDKSVYRVAQPVFLPPDWQKVFVFNGAPIDPNEVLKMVQIRPKPIRPRNYAPKDVGNAYAFFATNGLIKQTSGGMHKVRCPWVHEHSDGADNGTALFDPSPDNNMVGGFVCLHSHCIDRGIGDIFKLMGDGK